MTDLVLPPLGTIGVTKTYGSWFDRFVAGGIRYMTATEDMYHHFHDAAVNHSVVFVGQPPGFTKPQLVQAGTHGAQFAPWDIYGKDMIWLTEISQLREDGSLVRLNPTDEQRTKIAQAAIDCAVKKIGYNYLDFFTIAFAQKRWFHQTIKYNLKDNPWFVQLLLKRLSSPKHMICSQLSDYTWNQANLHLFADLRPTGLVSPEDLYLLQYAS